MIELKCLFYACEHRQAEMLERKRQRKLRQKEQKVRDQTKAADGYAASADTSSPLSSASAEVDSYIPDDNFPMPLDPIKLLNNDNDIDIEAQVGSTSDHSDSTTSRNTEHLKIHKNGFKHFKPRWQLPNSQKGRRNNFHGDHNLKREQRAAVVNGSKVWTKKFKPEYGGGGHVKTRVQNNAVIQTDQINCQLMIGSISVTVRNCPSQNKVGSLGEIQENCTTDTTCQLAESRSRELLEGNTTSAKEADQNLPTVSYHHSCELNGNDNKATNGIYAQMENEVKQEGMSFSVHAAKTFLAQSMYSFPYIFDL